MWNGFHKNKEDHYESKETKKIFFSSACKCIVYEPFMPGCGGKSEEAATDENGATIIKFGIHVANPEEQEPVTYKIVEAFNKANEGKYKVEFEAADTETHSKNMKLKQKMEHYHRFSGLKVLRQLNIVKPVF